jgi:hypothetical protein
MGLFWLAAAFFIPGLPQLIHLDILRALAIWLGPGIALFILGPPGAAVGVIAFLYNLYTASRY